MRNIKVETNIIWMHFKGNVITVIAVGKSSETLEEMVVYEHSGEIWIRPLSMFLDEESVKNRPDNKTGQEYRFERILKNDRY